jgi:putative toxin-antitoxin system antitoxin component (TIGR02293 family)
MASISKQKILRKAIEVFGSLEDSRRWFVTPAMALNQQTPSSLLTTEDGRDAVCTLLTQIEHCVYV